MKTDLQTQRHRERKTGRQTDRQTKTEAERDTIHMDMQCRERLRELPIAGFIAMTPISEGDSTSIASKVDNRRGRIDAREAL